MQSNWMDDLPCLPGAEQDFHLGAKATSYLPSATELDHVFDNDNFELPDWLESRENLGLSNIELFDDSKFEVDSAVSYQFNEEITKIEEDYDYGQTIKPEDMLVPLSDLKSETYTPQGIGANTLSAPTTTTFPNYSSVLTTSSNPTASSIPKVLIRVNKVQVAIPKQQNRTRSLANVQPSFEISGMQLQNSSRLQERSIGLQNCNNVQIQEPQYSSPLQIQQVQNSGYHQIDNAPSSNTDELLSELVEMAGNEPNALTNLISSFDSSVVQAGMDDLLSQLDSSNSQPELLDVSAWASVPASPLSVPSPVPASPLSVPSPVPSFGSLSPLSPDERSFHQQQTPTYTIDDTAIQPECNKTTFLSLWSPSTEDSMSVSSPSLTCEEESDGGYSKSEIHSYSRSPRKRKANPRSSAYPEGRKERKKEQNKQAALRYRHKKKQEDDEIMGKIEEEEERQRKLKEKYKDLKQELTYMKKIMREVLIAQGTLPVDAFKKAKKKK